MHIRPATADDRSALFDVWLRAVVVTHDFLSEPDIEALVPHVRDYLASESTQFWVLVDESKNPIGFMGMLANRMESLFLDPDHLRQGGGRRLVQHAMAAHDSLTVDVNEQNQTATAFYRACGFVQVGRSDLDHGGRPYPLLHLEWKRTS